jgi:hypothetical protein
LNTLDVNIEDIINKITEIPNVQIYQVSSDKNIGFCLNMAIAKCKSDYWAKMDDDDFYGESYLNDYMLNQCSHKFDIIGKKPSFVFLEGESSVYIRSTKTNNWHISNFVSTATDPHMCGATFCGTKTAGINNKFSEVIRSAVDNTWYEECVSNGLRIIIEDSYNMTIFRSNDKSKHTWRIDDDELKKNAVFVCNWYGNSIINL